LLEFWGEEKYLQMFLFFENQLWFSISSSTDEDNTEATPQNIIKKRRTSEITADEQASSSQDLVTHYDQVPNNPYSDIRPPSANPFGFNYMNQYADTDLHCSDCLNNSIEQGINKMIEGKRWLFG
jgi:hypothetical protein